MILHHTKVEISDGPGRGNVAVFEAGEFEFRIPAILFDEMGWPPKLAVSFLGDVSSEAKSLFDGEVEL